MRSSGLEFWGHGVLGYRCLTVFGFRVFGHTGHGVMGLWGLGSWGLGFWGFGFRGFGFLGFRGFRPTGMNFGCWGFGVTEFFGLVGLQRFRVWLGCSPFYSQF